MAAATWRSHTRQRLGTQQQRRTVLPTDNMPADAAQKRPSALHPANVDAGRQYGRPYSVCISQAGAACPGL